MPTQNVNLTSELDSFVKSQIERGFFNNASEVHRAALTALAKQEEERQARLESLKAAAQIGLDQIEAGDCTTVTTEEELSALMRSCLDRALQSIPGNQTEKVA